MGSSSSLSRKYCSTYCGKKVKGEGRVEGRESGEERREERGRGIVIFLQLARLFAEKVVFSFLNRYFYPTTD